MGISPGIPLLMYIRIAMNLLYPLIMEFILYTALINYRHVVDLFNSHPRCHSCNMFPLEGPRYHCQVCADFDFCQACFDKGQSHNHAFERIDDQGQPAVFVGSPRSRRRALRYGVLVSYTYMYMHHNDMQIQNPAVVIPQYRYL